MEFSVEFYVTEGGHAPVREFLLELKVKPLEKDEFRPFFGGTAPRSGVCGAIPSRRRSLGCGFANRGAPEGGRAFTEGACEETAHVPTADQSHRIARLRRAFAEHASPCRACAERRSPCPNRARRQVGGCRRVSCEVWESEMNGVRPIGNSPNLPENQRCPIAVGRLTLKIGSRISA